MKPSENEHAPALAEARRLGKPVIIAKRVEDCEESRPDCSFDSVTEYILPDGTTRTTRVHCN